MKLTPAELKVVKELVFLAIEQEGTSCKNIANNIGIGVETVRTHIKHAMEKNDFHDRTTLAIHAYKEFI